MLPIGILLSSFVTVQISAVGNFLGIGSLLYFTSVKNFSITNACFGFQLPCNISNVISQSSLVFGKFFLNSFKVSVKGGGTFSIESEKILDLLSSLFILFGKKIP